jgi:hypothetical protein
MSSDDQDRSIPEQREEMIPKAQREGIDLLNEFEDWGVSGMNMDRDGMQDALEFCQRQHALGQPIDVIVMWNTSRFSRSDSVETNRYVFDFRAAGTSRLFSHDGWVDFWDERDRMLFNITQDATNHRFLRDLSKAVLRGKKDAALRGCSPGCPTPFGFDKVIYDGAGGFVRRVTRHETVGIFDKQWTIEFAPIPEDDPDPARQLERQAVVWIFQAWLSGWWLSAICRELIARGVRPPRNRLPEGPAPRGRRRLRQRATAGDSWKINAVRYILKNPIYAGVQEFGRNPRGKLTRLVDGEIVPARQAKEALKEESTKPVSAALNSGGYVSLDTLQRSIQLLADKKGSRSPRGVLYPLSAGKIIRCGHCGWPMYGRTTKRWGKVYPVYICSQTSRVGSSCKNYSVREHRLIRLLADKVLEEYLGEEHLARLEKKIVEKVGRQYETKPREAEAGRAEAERLSGHFRNLVETLKSKELCDDVRAELVREMNEIARKKRDAEERLRAAEKAASVPRAEMDARVGAALEKLRSLRGNLTDALAAEYNDDIRRQIDWLLRLVVTRVDLYFRELAPGSKSKYDIDHGAITCRPRLSFGDGDSVGPKRVILFDGSELPELLAYPKSGTLELT